MLCFSQIDTIAGIRHSAIQGHTIIMLQTDDIHESFYDLFNRRFQRIDDPNSGTRLYANIAIGAHLKPCRVHPNFQCIVAIKSSELDQAPAPFLNRFEKYYITHKDILEFVLRCLPVGIISIVRTAINKVSTYDDCLVGCFLSVVYCTYKSQVSKEINFSIGSTVCTVHWWIIQRLWIV